LCDATELESLLNVPLYIFPVIIIKLIIRRRQLQDKIAAKKDIKFFQVKNILMIQTNIPVFKS